MLSQTLFKLGPYNICLWNVIFLSIIFFVAMILRRVIHRMLKRYLKSANIRVEGRKVTWLKLMSQSVYLIATYVAVLSFNINNENVTFGDFLNFNLIESKKFTLSFYHILVIIAIYFGAKMLLNVVKLYFNKKFREKGEYNAGSEYVYSQIAKYVIYVFAIITSLKALDVDLTLLLTGSAALLVGDFMLSKVLILSMEKNNLRLLEIVARAVREMSEGELLQIEKARRMDITEEVYFEVIRQKTASLISTCCEAGAISADREDMAPTMQKFGELVGLAFQIKDDIFDYGTPGNIGKPTGLDIRERKMTLPLIYALNAATKEVKSELINIVKNHNEDPKFVERAINLVIAQGGIEYAYKKMIELTDEALSLLMPIPDSEAKRSIIAMVEYTTQREK